MNPTKLITACAYARCSTLLKGQDPKLQIDQIREFARARNYDLVSEFLDSASGSNEKRPGLADLVKNAKAGKFKVVICAGIDRISRSSKHLLNLVDELRHYGVYLISIREGL